MMSRVRRGESMTPQIVSKKDAISSGLRKYFTGKACCHGHLAYRYLDGNCVQCMSVKRARPEQKSKRRKYSRERWQNSEAVRERGRILREGEFARRTKTDLQYILQHALRGRFYNAFKRGTKTGSAVKLLGCSI